jgi:azlC family protein
VKEGEHMNDKLDVKTAIKDTLPTVFGYIGIGLAFGIIASSVGINPFFVGAMSLFIYAGGAQFVTVSMLSSGFPILSIVLATFLINSRMILMSMATSPFFKRYSVFKNIIIGTFLTDESFALGMNKQNYTNGRLTYEWFNAANLVSYITWVVSSVAGALLGGIVKEPKALGLDFALVAMFIGLLYLQVISDFTIKKKVQFLVIVVVFFLVYFGMIVIPSNVLIIVVTLIGCAIGVVLKNVIY